MSVVNLDRLAADLAAKRDDIELRLIAEIFAEPIRSVPVARTAGIKPDDLWADDIRILYLGCELAADHRLDHHQMFRLVAPVLREHGYFAENAPLVPPFGTQWCAENLALLASSSFFSPTSIRGYVRQLRAIESRQRLAQDHINAARDLLAGRLA